MANPLTAAAFLAALKAEGVSVVEVDGWRTHNRNHMGAWGPLNGSIVHHTVTSGTAKTVGIVRDGYSTLPGPLCHGMIAKGGTVHLVGWGRTNHAGGGDPAVLAQVISENYGAAPSKPTKGNADGVDGNAHFYGWECENLGDGADPWPAAQVEAIVRVQAAVIRAHRAKGDAWGEDAKSVIGHREWSADKIDPRGIDMVRLRADVAERLTHPADWNSTTEEDDMAVTDADAKKIAAAVLNLDGVIDAPWSTDPDNQTWALKSVLTHVTKATLRTEKQLAAADATIAELVKTVGTLAAATADLDPAAIVAELTAAIEGIKVSINVDGAA